MTEGFIKATTAATAKAKVAAATPAAATAASSSSYDFKHASLCGPQIGNIASEFGPVRVAHARPALSGAGRLPRTCYGKRQSASPILRVCSVRRSGAVATSGRSCGVKTMRRHSGRDPIAPEPGLWRSDWLYRDQSADSGRLGPRAHLHPLAT
jgi:hypothetical protein